MSGERREEADLEAGDPRLMPARVIIEQPDGALDIGTDFSRLPKESLARAGSGRLAAGDAPGAAESAADSREHGQEEYVRRVRARLHASFQRTTLRTRRNVFLALVVTDFLFFSGVLIYQMVVRQGQRLSLPERPATVDTLIPVSWWINIPAIKLEDIIFSMVLDLLGVIGALHGRTSILSLFILLEALCTALITLAGLSLFHIFRLSLLVSAFYLRAALITVFNMLEAVGLDRSLPGQTTPTSYRQSVLQPLAPLVGFFGILFGFQDRAATVIVQPQNGGAVAAQQASQTQGQREAGGGAEAQPAGASAAAAAAAAAAAGAPGHAVVAVQQQQQQQQQQQRAHFGFRWPWRSGRSPGEEARGQAASPSGGTASQVISLQLLSSPSGRRLYHQAGRQGEPASGGARGPDDTAMQRIFLLEMNQMAESANAAALLSNSSRMRFSDGRDVHPAAPGASHRQPAAQGRSGGAQGV